MACSGEPGAVEGPPAEETVSHSSSQSSSQPTSTPEQVQQQKVLDIIGAGAQFSTLIELIALADLSETLRQKGPFTVFAPTNAAFAALPEGTVEKLKLAENKEQLRQLLRFHVTRARVGSQDASDRVKSIKTLTGEKLDVDGTANVLVVGDAVVTLADLEASNGIVHVIDAVLLPPAKASVQP
ncbi:MAG: fasciclin domain-containing protein [Pseudomonadota bacterium]